MLVGQIAAVAFTVLPPADTLIVVVSDPASEFGRFEVRFPPARSVSVVVRMSDDLPAPLPAALLGTPARMELLGRLSVSSVATIGILPSSVPQRRYVNTLPAGDYAVYQRIYTMDADAILGYEPAFVTAEIMILSRPVGPPAVVEDAARPSETGWLRSVSDRGFVLCDEDTLTRHAEAVGATNLLQRFVETEEGDSLLADGRVLPFMGVRPWTYRIAVISSTEVIVPELLGPIHGPVRRYRVRSSTATLALLRGEALEDWTKRSAFRLGEIAWPEDVLVEALRFDFPDHDSDDDAELHTIVIAKSRLFREGDILDLPWINVD